MEKYKILYINDWGGWGGAEKVTLNLVRYLDREKFEPYFILGSDGLFAKTLRIEGFTVYIVPMTPMSVPESKRYLLYLLLPIFFLRLLVYTYRVYRVTRYIQPDLIQTCSIQAKLIGSFVAKLLNIKLLWHIQNMQPSGYRRTIVRFLAKRFPDIIVATSQAVANIYTNTISSNKLLVNHASIDLVEFSDIDATSTRHLLESELGLVNEKIVVDVSMLRPGKGFHIFIRAAAEVLKTLPSTVFLIIGDVQFNRDYEYKDMLVELTRDLGLKDKVKFLGFRQDVHKIIAAADCLVHCPVEDDSLPTVVLEAMALQTPVVGTTKGGIPEEIDNRITGRLVTPGNEQELAQAIIEILANSALSEEFVFAAIRKLKTEFSSELFIDRFEQSYQELFIE